MTVAAEHLPTFPVLAGMAPERRAALLARLPRRTLAADDYVLREGEPNAHVVLILAGQFRAEREASSGSPVDVPLGPGDCAGEMSALTGDRTSASVRAVTPAMVALLPVTELEQEESGTVALRLAGQVADRLHHSNARLQLKQRHATAALKLQLRSSAMAALLIVPLAFYVLFVALRRPFAAFWPSATLVSAFLIMVCFAFAWVFVSRVSSPRLLGMSRSKARAGALAGLRWSVPVLVAAVGAKAFYVTTHPARAVFEPTAAADHVGPWLVGVAAYFLLAHLQEVVRCAIQGSIADYLHGGGIPDRWRSLLLSTVLFGATHVHLSIGFAALAMVGGAYWGWMYQRERNYWAPAISHALIGIWALFVVGIP